MFTYDKHLWIFIRKQIYNITQKDKILCGKYHSGKHSEDIVSSCPDHTKHITKIRIGLKVHYQCQKRRKK